MPRWVKASRSKVFLRVPRAPCQRRRPIVRRCASQFTTERICENRIPGTMIRSAESETLSEIRLAGRCHIGHKVVHAHRRERLDLQHKA